MQDTNMPENLSNKKHENLNDNSDNDKNDETSQIIKVSFNFQYFYNYDLSADKNDILHSSFIINYFTTITKKIMLEITNITQINYVFESNVFSIQALGTQNAVLELANKFSTNFPLSLALVFKDITPLKIPDISQKNDNDSNFTSYISKIDTKALPSIIDIKNMHENITKNADNKSINGSAIKNENIQNNNIEINKDENRFILFDFIKNISANQNEILDKENLQNIYDILLEKLIKNEVIAFKINDKCFSFSIKKISNNVMFNDIYSVKSYLRCDDINHIASIEKYLCKGYPKEVFCQNLADEIFFILPFDCFLSTFFAYIKYKKDIDFLFFSEQDLEKIDLQYTSYFKVKNATKKIIYSNHKIVPFLNLHLKDIINTFKSSNRRIIINLSLNMPSSFLIQNDENNFLNLLDISFNTNVSKMLDSIKNYPSGEKLLKNFYDFYNQSLQEKYKNGNIEQDLQDFQDINFNTDSKNTEVEEPKGADSKNTESKMPIFSDIDNISNNLLDIFNVVKEVLGFEKDLLTLANKCLRDRGPRIDYALIKNENNDITLDIVRILRSTMSFHLAGVEPILIAYGVIDSMCEFISNLCVDVLTNYEINEIFICGDLLQEKCFIDKITSCMPSNITLTMPYILKN